jgi:hypothetical protein
LSNPHHDRKRKAAVSDNGRKEGCREEVEFEGEVTKSVQNVRREDPG